MPRPKGSKNRPKAPAATPTTVEAPVKVPEVVASPPVGLLGLQEIEACVDMALKARAVTGPREDAVLCVLKGREIGVPMLESLQGIYLQNVDEDGGRREFCFTAGLIRSRVNKSGAGQLTPLQMDPEKVVLRATRFGVKGRPDTVLDFTYDQARAVRERRADREFFKKFPAATMLAWLTGEAGRSFFSDVLSGAVYTPEEFAGVETKGPAPAAAKETAKGTGKGAKAKDTPPKQDEAKKPELPALTYEFKVTRQGAEVIMRTAGVTLDQMREFAQLCTASGNLPGYDQRMIVWKDMMAELGFSEAKYLTKEQADAILSKLRPGGSRVGKKGKTRGELLDEICASRGCEKHRASVERLILLKLEVKGLDDASDQDWQLAVDEIANLMRDEAAFGLVIDRVMAQEVS